jgi:hypothetical protein
MYPKLKKSLIAMLTLLVLPISCDLYATQLIEGSERAHVQVNVSAKELNRLAITGRRIGIVVPSQKGAITYIKDEAAGALYFAFPKDASNPGTVTLFVTDEQVPTITYKLILIDCVAKKNNQWKSAFVSAPDQRADYGDDE